MAAANYLYNYVTRTSVTKDYKLLSCWTDDVTKYTAGSFYNFEEDNIPIYDLEERTLFNWQRLGFANAKPNSVHLVVSATAPNNLLTCNSNLFTSLQQAVDALPRFITVNTRITVASHGDLQSLNMAGISVDPNVKLEIVNINAFDKTGYFLSDPAYGTGTVGGGEVGKGYYYDCQVSGIATGNNLTDFGIYKEFFSSGLSEIPLGVSAYGSGGLADFLLRPDTALGVVSVGYRPRVTDFDYEPYVASSSPGVLDSRTASGVYYAYASPIPGVGRIGDTPSEISRLAFGPIRFSDARSITAPNQPTLNNAINSVKGVIDVYEDTSNADILADINFYDPSAYNMQLGVGSKTFRTAQKALFDVGYNNKPESVTKITVYGNSIQRATFSNCTGPIHLRNFNFVAPNSAVGIGLQVDSCPDLYVESCSFSKYNNFGVCLTNSKITFQRSLYIYRCYERSPDIAESTGGLIPTNDTWDSYIDLPPGSRLSKPWLENITDFDAPVNDRSAGLVAFNSQVQFADTETFTYNFKYQLTNFDLDDNPVYRAGFHSNKIISRCSTGIRLINSTMTGGQRVFPGKYQNDDGLMRRDFIHLEGNANYAIDMKNSLVDLKADLQVFHNTRGIRSQDSDLSLDSFKIDNNHIYGLHLKNTNFTYGTTQVQELAGGRFDFASADVFDTTNTKRYQFLFDTNGQHIVAKNSNIKFGALKDPKPSYLGRLIFRNAHGCSIGNSEPLPGVYLDNTKADFIHTTSLRDGVTNKNLVGGHVYATNNSEVTFLGSASSISQFRSVNNSVTYNQTKGFVGLVANDNSTLRFRGPTVIYDSAVDVLAENNSNVYFEPHKRSDGSLDLSSFPLTIPTNHTMVELKSLRSCLVADKGSNIIIEDLGDYNNKWDPAYIGNVTYDTTLNDVNLYTSAGFMQFYPGPNSDIYGTSPYSQIINTRGSGYKMQKDTTEDAYYWGINYIDPPGSNGPFDMSSITQGGLCIKALNNSNVKVRNVNFPCGWWNTSSVVYDANSPEGYCSRLFIWNFSNNSTLHASYLSVSSAYPSDVGYIGPSSVWVSGASNQPNYGAPSSTPDTSSLSVLDAFGFGYANVWPLPNGTKAYYGRPTPQNQGPFRLYVGVDSAANSLMLGSDETTLGYVTQVFAQGYNPSGSLSALDGASSLHAKLLRINDEGALATSGFYYSNEFIKVDPNNIMLDQSAANTFANAKNGAMGTSNRGQICTIYYATTDPEGEGRNSAGTASAGFRSPNIFDALGIN